MKKVTKKEQAKRHKVAMKRANYTKARAAKKAAALRKVAQD